MEPSTSTDHVQAVLAIEDRVLRNYWVTQTYADLSRALADLLQRDTCNWCTFGTWASCTVGQNIRGEQLPDWLAQRVVRSDGMMGVAEVANSAISDAHPDHHILRIVPEHLGEVVRELFGACARNLSDGNTQVFAEIAPPAATFIEVFAPVTPDVVKARKAVSAACAGATEFNGKNRLRIGYHLWCDAMAESDQVRRSQLILAGSIHLGAHEQHHLQGAIAASMDMGVNQSIDLLKARVTKDEPALAEIEASIDSLLHPVGLAIGDAWGDLMTELLGTITTPDGELRLNNDVPPLPGHAFIPSDLAPVVVDELAALLGEFSRADDQGHHSGALDWVNFDDRMNFIANLFLSRHHRTELFARPFDASTLRAIEAGRAPVTSGGRANRPSAPLRTRGGGPKAVFPRSVGIHQFTDELVATLRMTGDEPADTAVADYFSATGAQHFDLFTELAASSASAVSDEDLPGIGAFVSAKQAWPDWANPELVRAGQQVFGDYGPQLGMGLFMASLPADYAFAKGVQVLAFTTRLTHNPKRRYVETGQMIIDAMTPGALAPGESGYAAVRHVRLMHAAVRYVLSHLDDLDGNDPSPIGTWDSALGVPINQLQLLGTLFSFSVMGIEALKKSGVRLTHYEREAYIHVWNLIGHQIGVANELLPLSYEDSRSLWVHRQRSEYGPTEQGRELTRAAIECMQELFGFTQMPGLPATGIRHYLGNETADLLGVPKADWTRAIFELMQWTDHLYEFALVRLPGTGPIASMLGRRIWRGFELYGRDGKRPSFEVTDEFKDAWGMKRQ